MTIFGLKMMVKSGLEIPRAPSEWKKIGDVLIVSEQVWIICRSLGIRIAQFVEHELFVL